MKRGAAAIGVLIFFIVGIPLAVFIIIHIQNNIVGILYGECMEDALNTAQDLKTEFHKLSLMSGAAYSDPITVTLGDCVGSMLFINRERLLQEDLEIPDFLECVDGYNAYIIVGPHIEEAEGFWGWEYWSSKWSNMKNQIKEWVLKKLKMLDAFCIPLSSPKDTFEEPGGDPITLDGAQGFSGTQSYCIRLRKTGTSEEGNTYYTVEKIGDDKCT